MLEVDVVGVADLHRSAESRDDARATAGTGRVRLSTVGVDSDTWHASTVGKGRGGGAGRYVGQPHE